jgi:hypothetical protein
MRVLEVEVPVAGGSRGKPQAAGYLVDEGKSGPGSAVRRPGFSSAP